MSAHPPRVAVSLLKRRLSCEWRDYVLGDLEEEFRARYAASPLGAHRWFWWQTIRCVCAPPQARRNAQRIASSTPGDSMIRTLIADVRYALRVLSRTPSFAIAVVAVLALGIGANSAIFSIVNAVLLRPLPFEEADRVVRLFHVPPQDAFPGISLFPVSPANFYDWKRDARLYESMAIYRFGQFVLTGEGDARTLLAGTVGADFFDVVRTRPALGRVFLEEEDRPGRSHVVILSNGFWKSQFGGAADVINRTLTLDGERYTIVGVMPADFSIPAWGILSRDIWVPLAYTDAARAVRENHNAQAVARLKPDATLRDAQAEMDVISTRLEREFPKENAGWGGTVVPLQELIVRDVRVSLLVLLGAVALVLLIACANVGNLLFARSLTRRKELAIRAALGAGRARVFQQIVVESLVLAVAGGAAGLLLAHITLSTASALLATQLPLAAGTIPIDWRVLFFVAGTSVVTGILAGALPAFRAGRSDVNESLKEGGRGDGAVGIRTRRLLIACEVALSLVLLMGASVMLRSLAALRHVDAGFNPQQVLTLQIALPETRYREPARISAFFDTALERMRALPGVRSAGAIDDLPTQGGSVQPMVREGQTELLPRDQPTVEVRKVTPGYLKTMEIPLLRGRDVAESDEEVLLVSRSAAKLLWGDADPIGTRVTLPLQSRTTYKRVIGIVGDVKQGALSEAAAPTVYEYRRERDWRSMAVVLRTTVPPVTLARQAADAVRTLDRRQPVENIRTMDAIVEETLTSQRFSAWLLGLFASVALTLASVGIYSVLSYIVRGRSREIGIRAALGARTTDVLRLVLVEGMTPTLLGIAIGAIATFATAQILHRLIFGVSASDPLTLAVVSATMALVSLIASLAPAYRACRVDPLEVLRSN